MILRASSIERLVDDETGEVMPIAVAPFSSALRFLEKSMRY